MDILTVLTVLAVTIVVVTYFSSTLKRVAGLADSTIDTGIVVSETVLDLATDTVGTYKHEVKLSNAEKRSELLAKYENIGTIVGVDALDALHTKATTSETSKEG